MKKQDLKQLDRESLHNETVQMKKELFNLKLGRMSGQVKDLSQIRKLRASIARAKTFATQQQENN